MFNIKNLFAMFDNELCKKEQKAYHAINLKDFRYYWQAGAVLSKGALEKEYNDFTPFFSDPKDKEFGAWNDCFGNLKDLGRSFWRRENSVPNAYGPITLVFKSSIWTTFDDLTIRKNSITNANSEIIPKERWGEMYYKAANEKIRLKNEYGAAEFSTSSPISLNHLAFILVDPFIIRGRSIKEYVISIVNGTNSPRTLSENQIIERSIECQPQQLVASKLLKWSKNLSGKLLEQNENLTCSLPDDLKEYFFNLDEVKKRILASWLTYTFLGTIKPIEEKYGLESYFTND